MSVEGKLHIEATWDGNAVIAAAVHSSRSQPASRLLPGKTLRQASASVPLLFSLCGRAQGVAAAMAIEAALGTTVHAAEREMRGRLVQGEIIREYLWRVLLDWPARFGMPPRVQAMAEMRAALARLFGAPADDGAWRSVLHALRELLCREVLGCSPAQWLMLDTPQALEDWCAATDTVAAQTLRGGMRHGRFGTGNVMLMPPADAAWLREMAEPMRDETFAQQPVWRGAPLETGALARQRQQPLLCALMAAQGGSLFARMVARLLELAKMLEWAKMFEWANLADDAGSARWFGSLTLGGGAGLAWVETARGLLMHRILTDGERVLEYRIVAPTEWNFHANGALVQGLRGMTAESEDELQNKANWLVQSLDPCVDYEIAVRRA